MVVRLERHWLNSRFPMSEREPESTSLRLRYTNSLEDLLAFQDFHITHDAEAKRLVLRSKVLGGLAVGALLGFYGYLTTKNLLVAVPVGVVGAVLFAILFLVFVRSRMKRQIRAMHASGKDKKYTCEHVLVLKDDEFMAKTPFEATVTDIGKISRVDLTTTHAFIRIGPLGGFIVPLENLDEGDWAEFSAELGRRMAGQIGVTLRAGSS